MKEAIAINNKGEGDSLHDSVRRVTKSLVKIDEGAVLAALKDEGINVVEQMNSVKEIAMWKAGRVGSTAQRRQLRRHLRDHLGMNFFESEARVRMRCEGHTEVFTGTVDYYKDQNEKPEKISFTEKNIADEMKTMLARFVDSNLGDKREDWLERKHQSGDKLRQQRVGKQWYVQIIVIPIQQLLLRWRQLTSERVVDLGRI